MSLTFKGHMFVVYRYIREVVITSVLNKHPPCVGGGGLCKIPPV